MTMKILARPQVDLALRQEWLDTIKDLANQISVWVKQEPDWSMIPYEENEVEEQLLGTYSVTVWKIIIPEGEVRLEPIARNYPGRGIVELYAWPTLRRVHLLPSKDAAWQVRVDSGFNLRQPWDCAHFILLVRDLLGAEDMSETRSA